MKRTLSILLACAAALAAHADKQLSVKSPGGQVSVDITLGDKIYYDVISHGDTLLRKSHLGITIDGVELGINPQLKGQKQQRVSEVVKPVFALKAKEVDNTYSLLTMTMKGGYAVQWRVYDDGVAYRFQTTLKGRVKVQSEDITLQLAHKSELTLQQPGGFKTSCEEAYTTVKSNEWKADDKMSEVPLVVTQKKQRILVSEFDLFDYPGVFFRGGEDNSLTAVHPQQPLEFGPDGDRSVKFDKVADYIAETDGTRSYPWRFLSITQDDRQMANCTMPMRLAPACSIDDTSWIKPGKTTWEWWNGSIPYGNDVDFHSGLNLDTYKYFVDFAAQNGLEYILMDEGWAASTRDPFKPNPDIDLHELISYAKSKNVGIILWLTWLTVENNMTLFETFEKWGIKGVKIDFMDRQDQWMVNFYERVAKEAAKHHLFVGFHGAYHPSGMEYKYPNVLSFEGVRGMEYMGGCVPTNSAYYPYIRNAVGPMDYTPGAMLSAQPNCYSSRRPNSASMGTRAYQMALYVLFESHIQMLADNPTLYKMWPDCTRFIAGCPVNWDETHVLLAEFGQRTIVARRSGEKWYIGGITADRSINTTIDLSFLPAGKTYRMTSFTDGPNAGIQAMDYRTKESKVKSGDQLPIRMERNGGFAAVLEP